MMWAIVRRGIGGLAWGSATFCDQLPKHRDLESFADRAGPIDGEVRIEVFRIEPVSRHVAVEKSTFDIRTEEE